MRPLTLADAPAAYSLLRDCRSADGEPVETTFDEFVHSTFALPTADVPRDSVGAFTASGELVGFGWAFGREAATRGARMWLLGGVRPDHRRRGIGTGIVRAGIERARDAFTALPRSLPRTVDVEAYSWQADRLALLRAEGFEHVRSFLVMHRPIDAPVDVAPLAGGLVARNWEAALDEPARAAHNDAFRDHWGSEPVGMERWRHLGAEAPGFLADCSSIAVTTAGEVAGYVLCSAPPGMQREQRTAWIGTVGVRRDARGRGVATALLSRSIAAMRAAGFERVGLDVDADNPTGAVRVYERLGFRETRRQLIFSRPV
jgi:ribosomal protein S18 acetylase RimI-like enzyme